MVICNLDALLRERHLKISKVSADTRISRTTLTALCNNAGKGIQFDTANTLCIYLGIGMEQLFTTLPYEITVEDSTVIFDDFPYDAWESKVQLKYFDRKRTEFPIIIAHIETYSIDINQYGDSEDHYEITVRLPENNEGGECSNSEEENNLLKKVFQSMPPIAVQIVKDRIARGLIKDCSGNLFYVKFPDELTKKG